MIENLTAEQEALLDVYAEKYIRLAMESRPTDKPRAEAGIKALYAQEGLTEPEIRWFPSLSAMEAEGERLGVGKATGWDGLFDAGYFGWTDYCREVLGLVEETKDAQAAREIFLSCGPIIELEGLVLASPRPEYIRTDEQGELHCETGPSIRYAEDGTSLWHWHGFEVPRWVIEDPQRITPALINGETNAEMRRILTERFGLWRYLSEVNADVLDEDWDGGTKEAPGPNGHRALLRHGDTTALLCGDPSTGRVYALDVPPGTKTCVEANGFLAAGADRAKQWGRS